MHMKYMYYKFHSTHTSLYSHIVDVTSLTWLLLKTWDQCCRELTSPKTLLRENCYNELIIQMTLSIFLALILLCFQTKDCCILNITAFYLLTSLVITIVVYN